VAKKSLNAETQSGQKKEEKKEEKNRNEKTKQEKSHIPKEVSYRGKVKCGDSAATW
jgi:hypothetical protein